MIQIEKGAESLGTHCACCGRTTRSINGFASNDVGALAAYFVRWTDGHVLDGGASFDFIIGEWGDDALSERVAVGLEFSVTEYGPQFMVVDAFDRPVAKSDLVGKSLSREEVIGTPLAQDIFAIADAIWLQDDRIAPLKLAGYDH